eukprot:Skav222163  [mRNA]  locus=scaffold3048:58569:66882:- [translate_table: standard]
MNDLVILQSTQGICAYLESVYGSAAANRGVCVGFDHRAAAGCSSKSFALQAAKVFLSSSFKVWLFHEVVATPFVPWCLEQCGCCAGVMVTASHNPAADNGYKIYWSNGAQIIPPHDAKMAAFIEENLEPWESLADVQEVLNHPLCKDPKADGVMDAYFHRLPSLRCSEENVATAMSVVYTAMHGVGCPFVLQAFDAFGHRDSLHLVAAQCEPDPTFPTVAFPNPEEGKGALKLAFEEADRVGSNLVLANDPDADRLAVAERSGPKASWHVFTGNELGALLGHWAWCCWRKRHPQGDASKVRMVGSAVSSKFLARIASHEGFRFVETLTGFKWMGSKSAELRAEGYDVIFAYEEAIGFCCGDLVKDKDGIAAASVFVEMAKALLKEGKSCQQQLEQLYRKYGALQSLNSYVKSPDSSLTTRIFAAQRGSDKSCYPKTVGDFKVTAVRDLTIGYDSRTSDGQPELPLNLGGEMITYYFSEVNAEVTLRSSGTEPKIKWYSEMRSDVAGDPKLQQLVRSVVCTLLDPVANGLEIRSEDRELLMAQGGLLLGSTDRQARGERQAMLGTRPAQAEARAEVTSSRARKPPLRGSCRFSSDCREPGAEPGTADPLSDTMRGTMGKATPTVPGLGCRAAVETAAALILQRYWRKQRRQPAPAPLGPCRLYQGGAYPHHAAARIQRAWRVSLWRRAFMAYAEHQAFVQCVRPEGLPFSCAQVGWLGSFEWLLRNQKVFGTELAEAEDRQLWSLEKSLAPPDNDIDPWGHRELHRHLAVPWRRGVKGGLLMFHGACTA